MEKEPVIIVENLTARFGENTILKEVTFQVDRGEIFVILGGSGCGKSTLLKHMIGLLTPYSGRVIIQGTDITHAGEQELMKVKRTIGVLFQSGALFGSMTLAENVALPLTDFTDLSPREIEQVVKMKLAMVGLSGYENHYPSEISGGMQKRAGLARAMALDPTILFFDEPSAGLDPLMSVGIDEMIKALNKGLGTTMVIVTHELDSIFNISQRVIMLDREEKGIIAEGDPKVMKEKSDDPRVTSFFNRQKLEVG